MSLFDRVIDLPVTIKSVSHDRFESNTLSGFLCKMAVSSLAGDGAADHGEDVACDAEDRDILADTPEDAFDLAGSYDSFTAFSTALDGVDLFPTKAPEHETAEYYRCWVLGSAGLDLAFRQADTDLASAASHERDPLRLAVSTRLGNPPPADRVELLAARDPDCEFKLDPTTDWDDEFVMSPAARGRVRILDLRGCCEGADVDQVPNPELYKRILLGFPDAVVEDPAFTDETCLLLDGHEGRASWGAPITGVKSAEHPLFEPSWLSVKPSRLGTVESLLDTIEYAGERGMSLYGGGQFELDVRRGHIQLLASVFYPDGPNDVAPCEYNLPDPPADLPTSPLMPSTNPSGLEF